MYFKQKLNMGLIFGALVLVSQMSSAMSYDECTERADREIASGKKVVLACDGHMLRCEEGGDAVNNKIGYQLSNPVVKYDDSTSTMTLRVKSSFVRCVFLTEPVPGESEGTVGVVQVNPFSVHEFPWYDLNTGKSVRAKARLLGVEMMATNFDQPGNLLSVDRKTLKEDGPKTTGSSLMFELSFNINKALSAEKLASLNAGDDVDLKIELTGKTKNSQNPEDNYSAGGSHILFATLAMNAKAKIMVKKAYFVNYK